MRANLEIKKTAKQSNIAGGKLLDRIDVKNDSAMVEAGIRKPKLEINRSVFEHTASEKIRLKLEKRRGGFESTDFKIVKPSLHKFKLVVYMKKSPVKNFKSTHSLLVYKEDVDSILASFKHEGYIINKVYFNNRNYV